MKYKLDISLPELIIKDYEYNAFCKRYSEMSELLVQMKNFIGKNHKNYLVNVTVRDHSVGDKTCVDTRYHFDGDYYSDNIYCIWCKGPNRTVFPIDKVEFQTVPNSRFDQNVFLEEMLKKVPAKEIDEETFIKYTSRDPHKGVVCKNPGKRIFVRLMGTNYIEPKNYVKKTYK